MARTTPPKGSKVTAEAEPELVRFDPDDNDDVDGDPNWEFKLDDDSIDPSRRYAYPHNDLDDIRKFKALGYRIETHHEGGVRLHVQPEDMKDGEAICVRDHILMSCDLERHEKREAARHKRANKVFTQKMAEARGRIELRAQD